MPLKARRKAFAEYYLAGCSASEAARKAGYSEATARYASRWLNPQKPTEYDADLATYVQERLDSQNKQLVASADEVLQFFTRVMRGEEKDQFGLDAALDTRMTAGRELLKRHDVVKNADEEKTDDGLKKSLEDAAKRVCAGCDDSAMLPESDDNGNENS